MADSPEHDERLIRWVREHGPAVRGFLRATLRDADLADDLLQEVFCRAWQARTEYADQGQEKAYLLRIADRLARDQFRRAAVRRSMLRRDVPPEQLDDPTGERPGDSLARREAERQLHQALDELTEPQRRTLLLRYHGELGFAEIARLMACPLNTVLSHCRRGLETLRKLLIEHS